MMKIILFFIPLLSLLGLSFDNPKMIIKQNDYSVVDKLGNLYLINKDEIEKYKDGIAIKKYSKKTFGRISSVDASNAMRILLFYKNANKVIFLDNQLSENSDALDLFRLPSITVSAVCNSSNNQFWVFDANNAELLKISTDLSISLRTGNLNNQINEKITPILIKEVNNQLYLLDQTLGLFVFDYFGTLIKKIPLFGLKNFNADNTGLFYTDRNNYIYRYDFLSFEREKIDSCFNCKIFYFSYPYLIKHIQDTVSYKSSIQP